MPVNATIPLTQDFLQTAGTYPLLTELIQHPTNGYLYGCYTEAGVGKILKLKNDDYSDVTVASLPVTAPIDMHYSATNDRFYIVYRTTNSPVTEVHPTTLAMVAFFSITSVGGQGAITGDTANLYVATFSTQKLYSISLATGLQVGLRTMPATGYAKINCLRYFSPKLYALSMDVDYVQLSRIAPANLGTEEVSTPIGIDAGEVPVDDMGESSGHIYVGNRDLLGIIRKFSKTDFLNPELIETTQLSKCTCAKTVGGFVWAAFENGRGVRINPANVADRRIYTLNDGQGYHSEFTGTGSEFVHTYNLNTGKIARYHIPSDVVPATAQWLSVPAQFVISLGAAVATDSGGNVVLVGEFNNTINFGDGTIGHGDKDGFIAKYTAEGQFLWSKALGANLTDASLSVTIDSDDNIIVGGYFQSQANCAAQNRCPDFDGVTLISNGGFDIFIAKYSASGAGLWAKSYGSFGNDTGNAIAIDQNDDVILAVKTGLDVNFGGVPLTGLGFSDVVVAKLDADDGSTLWAKLWGGAGNDIPGGVAIDSANNIWVTGQSQGGNFGGGAKPAGIFLAKYANSDGAPLFDTVLEGTGIGNAIAIDPITGNIYIAGAFSGSMDFGGGTVGGGNGGIFIAGYRPAGTWLWQKFQGRDPDGGKCVAVDSLGNLALGGVKGGNYFLIVYRVSGDLEPTLKWELNGTGPGSSVLGAKINGTLLACGGYKGSEQFGGKPANSGTSSFFSHWLASFNI